MPMPLNQLLPQAPSSTLIRELTLDSRRIKAGDLFFAVPGEQLDGRLYIADAVARGAAAVAYEADSAPQIPDCQAVLLPIRGLQAQLSAIAGRFYGEPSRTMNMVGVTGTNGKTTVSQLLAQALEALGEKCGVIGTLGNGFPGSLQSSGYTTPDPVELQAALARLKQGGADTVVMEVSSHGLQQQRLAAVELDYAVLTNLSREHLDYHKNMQAYAEAKAKLFAWPNLRACIINLDDAFGIELAERYTGKAVKTYSLERSDARVYCRKMDFGPQGIQASLVINQSEALLRSNLLGRFNLSNLLAVITTLLAMGYAMTDILAIIPQLRAPAGRMQTLAQAGKPLVVIDYAHTPDALAQALIAVRAHVAAEGRLLLVFGCGGERDSGKRPLMAQVAAAYADQLFVTDDNPRGEDAASIRQEILMGIPAQTRVDEIGGRAAAIAAAIAAAKESDVVLIAGKGHEAYQEVGGARSAFSDFEQAGLALQNVEMSHV